MRKKVPDLRRRITGLKRKIKRDLAAQERKLYQLRLELAKELSKDFCGGSLNCPECGRFMHRADNPSRSLDKRFWRLCGSCEQLYPADGPASIEEQAATCAKRPKQQIPSDHDVDWYLEIARRTKETQYWIEEEKRVFDKAFLRRST